MTAVLQQPSSQLVRQCAEHLSSPSCPRDLKLVCRDGTLFWSAISLAHWSAVVRAFVSEERGAICHCQAYDSTMVLLLPDVGTAAMRKVLAWSNQGVVLLGREEADEVLEVLLALGVMVTILQNSVTEEQRVVACQYCQESFASEEDLEEHSTFYCHQAAACAFQDDHDDGDGDWDGDGQTEEQQWGMDAADDDCDPIELDDDDDAFKARNANMTDSGQALRALSLKKEEVEMEEGERVLHHYYYKAEEDSSLVLPSAAGSKVFKIDVRARTKRDCEALRALYGRHCSTCRVANFQSPVFAWRHLVCSHFFDQALQIHGDGRACAACGRDVVAEGKKRKGGVASRKTSIGQHVATVHRDRLRRLVPKEVRMLFVGSNEKTPAAATAAAAAAPAAPDSLQGPGDGGLGATEGGGKKVAPLRPDAAALEKTPMAKDLAKLRRLFKGCITCQRGNLHSPVFAWRHLAYAHFWREAEAVFGGRRACAVCRQVSFKEWQQCASNRKIVIGNHVAGAHRDRLRELVPPEVGRLFLGRKEKESMADRSKALEPGHRIKTEPDDHRAEAAPERRPKGKKKARYARARLFDDCSTCAHVKAQGPYFTWRHLAYRHFPEETLALFGGKDRKECSLCGHLVVKEHHQIASDRKLAIVSHLITAHRDERLLAILDPGAGPGGVVSDGSPPPPPSSPPGGEEAETTVEAPGGARGSSPPLPPWQGPPPQGDRFPECSVCQTGKFRCRTRRLRHLAYSHFSETVFRLFGEGPACGVCGREVVKDHFKGRASVKLAVASHFASWHRDVLLAGGEGAAAAAAAGHRNCTAATAAGGKIRKKSKLVGKVKVASSRSKRFRLDDKDTACFKCRSGFR